MSAQAAAIGAARRAAHALEVSATHGGDVRKLPFPTFLTERSADPALVVAARPRPWAVSAYAGLAARYRDFEDSCAAAVAEAAARGAVAAAQHRDDEPVVW